MIGSRTRQLLTFLVATSAFVCVLALSGSANADPTVASKRAEARAALAQIESMDRELSRIIDRYDGATWNLQQTERQLGKTRVTLGIARKSLKRAHLILARRVISLYTDGGASSSTIAILFGASSFQDMLNSLDAVQRMSDHDAQVVKQVTSFSKQIAKQEKTFEKARDRQKRLVAQIASERGAVEAKMAARQRFYQSVKREIAATIAADQRRQEAIDAAARIRVETQSSVPPSATAENIAAAPSSSIGDQAVSIAMQYLGTPYVWGGASPSGFDCSGFVMYVFSQVGISLPHYTVDQYNGGVAVSRDALEPGDLVFFDGLGHVGIYIGGGQFVHAPHTGDVVKVSSLGESWYASTYVGARRYGT